MISYSSAIEIVRTEAAKGSLTAESVFLTEVPGRICADNIHAPVANQPFDNSAMDGYALRAEDIACAANDNPVVLEMIGHIAAGDSAQFSLPGPGQCYEIMTGAPLPRGCDAVVPVELISKRERNIIFNSRTEAGDNIRRTGEDFNIGDKIIGRGHILNDGHILILATLGIDRIKVLRKPSIALISTGREIIDISGNTLAPGQIYNSTMPYLRSALSSLSTNIHSFETVTDDPQLFREKIQIMIKNKVDIVISTGAVSAGAHDFVPSVLKELGAEIFFHKVSIRPGKPLIFARLPDGMLFFGLPGNPVASAAGLRFFIDPALRALRGLPPEEPQYALLNTPFKKSHNLRHFVRAQINYTDTAILKADIPAKQQSFMVRPFTDTNAWAVIPEETKNLEAGTPVQIFSDRTCPFH